MKCHLVSWQVMTKDEEASTAACVSLNRRLEGRTCSLIFCAREEKTLFRLFLSHPRLPWSPFTYSCITAHLLPHCLFPGSDLFPIPALSILMWAVSMSPFRPVCLSHFISFLFMFCLHTDLVLIFKALPVQLCFFLQESNYVNKLCKRRRKRCTHPTLKTIQVKKNGSWRKTLRGNPEKARF